MEVDETFRSFEDWKAYFERNPWVFDAGHSDRLAEGILATGFVEPLTGQVAGPGFCDASFRNWREGLGFLGRNSRTRAVMHLIEREIGHRPPGQVSIYAPEAVTALALCLRGLCARFLGSEYLETDERRRAMFPIPHEDIMRLSFRDDAFDMVTTNEVLEHVPDLDAALAEIARVLRPGGAHIGTVPFLCVHRESLVKARIVDGRVLHLTEPEYHGNPVDPAGSLVFAIPGWDLLDRARRAGFSDACIRFVASARHGYVAENTGIFVFCARK